MEQSRPHVFEFWYIYWKEAKIYGRLASINYKLKGLTNWEEELSPAQRGLIVLNSSMRIQSIYSCSKQSRPPPQSTRTPQSTCGRFSGKVEVCYSATSILFFLGRIIGTHKFEIYFGLNKRCKISIKRNIHFNPFSLAIQFYYIMNSDLFHNIRDIQITDYLVG